MKAKKILGTLALGALIGSALGLFFSPDSGKKNRVKFKKIAKTVSEKLVEETSKIKEISKKEYDAVVERIIKKYSKDDLLKPEAWMEIGNELKERWTDIQKEMSPKKGKTKK